MENNNIEKINIFKKIWYSITKFEKYADMASEGLGSAIKYLILITAILSIFSVIGSLLEMNKLVLSLADYIEENIPEFSYENGKISIETEEPIIINEIKYNGVDRIVIDSHASTEEEKNKTKEKNDIIGTTIFFYEDQIVLKSKSERNQIAEQQYTYKDFISRYSQEDINKFNKNELVQYMKTNEKMKTYYFRYTMSITIYLLVINIIVVLLDALELAVLGFITTLIARIRMRFVAIYNMAIYALTLPIFLNIIYIVINYFKDFTISYFQVAYMTIAYIYIAAAIFIIKEDYIKKQQEVDRIREEQLKVREEIKEQEREKEERERKKREEKKKEDEKEDEDKNQPDEEPKGSEA